MSTYEVEDNSINGVAPILQLLQHFFPYAQKQLGFHKPVMISFESDEENSNKLLGRTGHYNPDDFSIGIYVDGRHPKDVLRSLSHELIHHTQNCNGEFDAMENLGPGYAQDNPAMRDAELDAYKRGNIIFRDFEDLIKKGEIACDIDFEELGEPRMSLKEWKNNELNMLLLKKWGLLKEGTAIPKAGRIDRTDIANKAPDEWIKEGMPRYRDEEHEEESLEEFKLQAAGGSGLPAALQGQMRQRADNEQRRALKREPGTGPGTSVPPASAGRREDLYEGEEELEEAEGAVRRKGSASDTALAQGPVNEVDPRKQSAEKTLAQTMADAEDERVSSDVNYGSATSYASHAGTADLMNLAGDKAQALARANAERANASRDQTGGTGSGTSGRREDLYEGDPHMYGAMKRAAKRAGKKAVDVAGNVQQAVFGDAKPEKGVTGGKVTSGGSQGAPEGGDDDAEEITELSRWHKLAGLEEQDTVDFDEPPDTTPTTTPATTTTPAATPTAQVAPTPHPVTTGGDAFARRDDGKEHADEEGNRPSMARRMRLRKETITLDEARDLARRIFEKLTQEPEEELTEADDDVSSKLKTAADAAFGNFDAAAADTTKKETK